MASSFRVADGLLSGERKQVGIWSRRTKEGEEIDQKIGGEFESTRNMVDGLGGIVAHDERVGSKGFAAVGTQVIQAAHTSSDEVIIRDDEHDIFLSHT
jgi:hypothetical protein